MTQPRSSFSEVCADPPLRTQLWGMSAADRRRVSIRRVFFSLRQKQWPSSAELCTVMDLLPGWMVALGSEGGGGGEFQGRDFQVGLDLFFFYFVGQNVKWNSRTAR